MDCEPCPFVDTVQPGLQTRIERRRGMLAKVVRSGEVRIGDAILTRRAEPC